MRTLFWLARPEMEKGQIKHTNRQSGHDEELSSVAKEDTQNQRISWTSKHIAVDQLPSRVFLHSIFHSAVCSGHIIQIEGVEAIVSSNVLPQCPKQDHANHATEEDHEY